MTNRRLAFGDVMNPACARLTGLVSVRQLVQSQMVLLVEQLSCSGRKTLTRSVADDCTGSNRHKHCLPASARV